MNSKPRSGGFTLLEMTIAITITAITGLSVAGATIALSRAHADTEGFYQSLQTARSAMMRIQRTVQGSKLITACTGTVLVLWVDDTNGNGVINANEIVIIAFDSTAREVRVSRKVFPEAVADALNVEVPLDPLTDVGTAIPLVLPSAYAQTVVLATDASDFFSAASPPPPMSARVDLRLSVGTGQNLITLRTSATTRGGRTANVDVVNGDYVLTTD